MKNAGRIIVFFVALVAIVGAVLSVSSFFTSAAPGGGVGSIPLSLCGLSSAPEDIVIGTYLEANAGALEQPAGNDDTTVTFIVESGETAVDIAARLVEKELISDAELFRRYVQYHGLDADIEVGEFTLRQTMTIPQIAEALQQGRRPEQTVTIQEGLRLEQIAVLVAEQTGVAQTEFLSLVTTGWRTAGLSFSFLSDIPPNATLEGFLLPETYRLSEEATAIDLLTRMLETFETRVTSDMRAAAANRGLDAYGLVTLASIVEREAVLVEERPLIAGVYHNRLDDGWFLGADPTVQYGLNNADNWWPVLTLYDLESTSLYNTYRNLGLPPGPICNPGIDSIRATAYPQDTDYFFFLADCATQDGSHLFAVSAEEHNSNYAMCGGTIQ
ncbi:MAG: endolytic transglycosylase MltG [Chloroflexi bacterium]|nr:endolytic transglycosylase MltG [Chloroflexota bacterium]